MIDSGWGSLLFADLIGGIPVDVHSRDFNEEYEMFKSKCYSFGCSMYKAGHDTRKRFDSISTQC